MLAAAVRQHTLGDAQALLDAYAERCRKCVTTENEAAAGWQDTETELVEIPATHMNESDPLLRATKTRRRARKTKTPRNFFVPVADVSECEPSPSVSAASTSASASTKSKPEQTSKRMTSKQRAGANAGVEVMGADAVFLGALVTTLRSLPKRGMLLSSIGTSPEYKTFKQQVETDPQLRQTKGKAALLKLLQDDSRFEIRNTAPASQPAKIYWAFLNQAPDRSEAGKEEEAQALEKYYQAFEAILRENGGRAVCCDNQQLGTDSRIRKLKRSNPMGSLHSILHRCPDQGRFEIKYNHQVDAGSAGAYTVKLGPGNKYAGASSSSAGCAGAQEQGAERPWWVPDAELFTRFWDVIEQILREHAHAGTSREAVDPAAITSDIRYQALKAELPGSNLTLRRIIRHCEDPGRFQLVDPRSEGGTTTYAVKLGKSWSSSVNRMAGDHGRGQHQQQQNFDSNSTTLQPIQEATAPLLRALEEQRAQSEKLQAEQKAQSERLQAGMAKLQGMVASTLVLMQSLQGREAGAAGPAASSSIQDIW